MIETSIKKLRDPFILVENGVYYAYGTGVPDMTDWNDTVYACFKNVSGKLDGEWTRLPQIYVNPPHAIKNRWAPEVHKYKGAFYMFTTYFSDETNHRGSTILRSESPEGPFVEITNGHITRPDWDCIDATFYVDREGQPWMIFVHEWTCTEDRIGRMAAAKLSEDLTHFISEPIELFRADDPKWAGGRGVTDGCFMYDTEDGGLIMLWSNFDDHGYAVGVAKSSNGRVDGEWIQEKIPIFSRLMTGKYDGGHGMIFTSLEGEKYLCLHSPNKPSPEREEVPVLIPIEEKKGSIVCIL